MKKVVCAVLIGAVSLVGGCGTSKVSSVPVVNAPKHQVKVVAMAQGGGVLADAIGIELAGRGLTVIDASSTSNMMARLNLNEVEIAMPTGLDKLRAQGIDAFLSIRSVGGYDQVPQSATVRMNSTHTGQLLAGVSWQNGWGGQAGSPSDRVMRKGLTDAASEITDALVQRIR